MRLVTYVQDSLPVVGMVHGDDLVTPIDAILPELEGYDMISFLAADPRLRQQAASSVAARCGDTSSLQLGSLTLLAPVIRPSKIIGAARNYYDGLTELKLEPPARPQLFAKLPNTILAPGAPIPLCRASTAVTYEGELAVVIGHRGRRIPREHANDYIGAYTVLNDVSATDITRRDGFLLGKNLDGFCPFGPILVTPDEIKNPQNLRLTTFLDGYAVQDSNTSQMVFGIAALIEAVSEVMTLEIGDIIATGTPAGVAAAHTPPLFLRDGMTVSISIEGIGTLRNSVIEINV